MNDDDFDERGAGGESGSTNLDLLTLLPDEVVTTGVDGAGDESRSLALDFRPLREERPRAMDEPHLEYQNHLISERNT